MSLMRSQRRRQRRSQNEEDSPPGALLPPPPVAEPPLPPPPVPHPPAPARPLLRHDIAIHQVYSGGDILGCIKPVNPNERKEAISIYCRLHGCSPPLGRAAASMPTRLLLRWFADALEMGRSRDHRAERLAAFHRLEREWKHEEHGD